jgi:ABC-type transport system involved in multi-copper enzyme maturation permease subunit
VKHLDIGFGENLFAIHAGHNRPFKTRPEQYKHSEFDCKVHGTLGGLIEQNSWNLSVSGTWWIFLGQRLSSGVSTDAGGVGLGAIERGKAWGQAMRLRIEFPLLKRQALQLAQRRRLWLVRALLSVTQLIFVVPIYAAAISSDVFSALGSGGNLMSVLLTCNLVLIYLLQPLSACAAISSERERQTLPLLLISRISPARLVWEKFLWSLQLVFAAILVSLPAMAFAYTLGGLSGAQLVTGVVVMFVAALQVNSAGIFWSSLCGSSLQAFWGTLLTLLLLLLGPVVLFVAEIWPFREDLFGQLPMAALFCNFWQMLDSGVELADLFSADVLLSFLLNLSPPLFVSILLLVLSGLVVSRYRWEAPLTLFRNWLRELRFRRSVSPESTPAKFAGAVEDTGGQPREVRDPGKKFALFPDQPLAARECSASVTALPITHLVLSVILVLLLWLMVNSQLAAPVFGASLVLQICVFLLGVLQVQSLASRAIGSERDRETLPVLLTVPMTSAEIIRQKLAAASRFRNLLMLPLGVLLVISLFWGTTFLPGAGQERFNLFGDDWGALISHLLLFLIYWQQLTLALRVGGLCSLITRTTLRSAALTLGILFGYSMLHVFAVVLLESPLRWIELDGLIASAPLAGMVCLLSDSFPGRRSGEMLPYTSFFSGLAAMAVLLLVLRVVTEQYAGRFLQRPD